MITKIYNGNVIEYEDDIEHLTIDRFMKYNYLLSVHAKLGSDMEGVNDKIDPLIVMNSKGDKDSVHNALLSMKQNILIMHQNMHPKMMAFAALVHKVNGKEVNDISDNGLMSTVNLISKFRITWGMIKFIIDQVKKKSKRKLRPTFLI